MKIVICFDYSRFCVPANFDQEMALENIRPIHQTFGIYTNILFKVWELCVTNHYKCILSTPWKNWNFIHPFFFKYRNILIPVSASIDSSFEAKKPKKTKLWLRHKIGNSKLMYQQFFIYIDETEWFSSHLLQTSIKIFVKLHPPSSSPAIRYPL